MEIIGTTFEKLPRERLVIGFEGENQRATVRIDCASVFAEYPNATPALIVKPLFADAYPVVVDRNGTDVDWLITSEILSFSGDGEIQLVFYKDQVICKSAVSKIRVSRSLQVTGEMPDPVVQWIEDANRKLAEVDAQIVELEGMVDTATDAATRAEQSASTASTKAEQAAGSAATATEKATEATNAAGTATAKAAEAEQSALTATEKANAAAESERIATAKAGDATTAAGTATAKAEQATEAAQTATEKAGDASASARAAQTSATDAASSATAASASETAAKASETAASTSATQAAQSVLDAGANAQTAMQKAAEATQSATNAETSATNAATSAETASTKAGEAAQSAQAVAETAEQLADSLEQISQNTADIAEHEQYAEATYAKKTDLYKKADIIKSTASGAIASFPDGAEMPVDEVTAQINPVQDLHGYENPWPAGGGVNKIDYLSCVGVGARDGTDSVYRNNTSISGTELTINQAYGDNGGILKGVGTFPLATGEYVTISGKATLTGTSGLVVGISNYDGGGTNNINANVTVTNGRFSVKLDAKSDYAKTGIFLQPQTARSTAVISDVMVALGQTEQPYSPYDNICPISGFEGLTVTRTGKNLYDKSTYPFKQYSQYNPAVCWTDPIFVKAGTYTFKNASGFGNCYLNIYHTLDDAVSKTNIVSQPSFPDNTPYTYTFASDSYIRCQQNNTGGTSESYALVTNSWQMELGTTATDYEPYSGTTLPISWQTEAGTVYGGSLTIAEDGSGVLTVDRASVDMGTITWEWGWSGWYEDDIKVPVLANVLPNVICSQYKTVLFVNSTAPSISVVYGGEGYVSNGNMIVKDSRYSDAASFKSAMSGVQLVYELAEPITYNLTASEITTLLGENNLWHDANGDISVGYKADTKLYIDNKITQAIAAALNS